MIFNNANTTSDYTKVVSWLIAKIVSGISEYLTHLAIQPDATQVQDNDNNKENRDPDTRVDVRSPELDYGGSSTNLSRNRNGHGIPFRGQLVSHFRELVMRNKQKFQPVAAPRAGSTTLVACRTKPPV
jgi:hypothetical protein